MGSLFLQKNGFKFNEWVRIYSLQAIKASSPTNWNLANRLFLIIQPSINKWTYHKNWTHFLQKKWTHFLKKVNPFCKMNPLGFCILFIALSQKRAIKMISPQKALIFQGFFAFFGRNFLVRFCRWKMSIFRYWIDLNSYQKI